MKNNCETFPFRNEKNLAEKLEIDRVASEIYINLKEIRGIEQ